MRCDDGAGPAAAVHMGMSGSGGLRSQWGLCCEPIEDDMGTSKSDLSWMVGDSILCCSALWGSRMWGFRAPPNPPLSPRGPTFPCSVCSSFHAKWKWGLFFLFFPPLLLRVANGVFPRRVSLQPAPLRHRSQRCRVPGMPMSPHCHCKVHLS